MCKTCRTWQLAQFSKLIGMLVLPLALSLAAHAGSTVYKCQTDKGLVMQDVPCANAAQTKSVGNYNAPRMCGSACTAQDLNGSRNTSARRDVAETEQPFDAIDAANEDPRSVSGTAARNARVEEESRQWNCHNGRKELCDHSQASHHANQDQGVVNRTGPGYTEPKRIQDQYGNGYIQPPGSTFATDEKTGKQCFVNGAFIDCN
jgi:hypothetical protein